MAAKRDRRSMTAGAIIALQAVAAVYFLIDAVNERAAESDPLALSALDLLVGLALLCGVAYAALTLRRMAEEARRREAALAIARGALSRLKSPPHAVPPRERCDRS